MFDLMNLSEEMKHGKIISSGKNLVIMTPLARLCFCNLDEPTQYKGRGAFRYGVDLVFETDPSKPAAVDVKKVLFPAMFEFAKSLGIKPDEVKSARKNGIILGSKDLTIRIGERFTEEGEPYEGYSKSTVSMAANSTPKRQTPPWDGIPCVSPAGEANFDPSNLYSGCYGRAFINPYYSKKWNVLAIGLQSVQMVADGDNLGGGSMSGEAAASAFGAVPGAEVKSSFEKATEGGDFSSYLEE